MQVICVYIVTSSCSRCFRRFFSTLFSQTPFFVLFSRRRCRTVPPSACRVNSLNLGPFIQLDFPVSCLPDTCLNSPLCAHTISVLSPVFYRSLFNIYNTRRIYFCYDPLPHTVKNVAFTEYKKYVEP